MNGGWKVTGKPKFKFEVEPDFELENNDPDFVLEDDTSEENRVATNFAGRSFFITGGTGFLGKVLVEKLLRTCVDIKKIYLLVRPKKGKSPQERIQTMIDNVLFDTVRQQRGEEELLAKVQVIAGDVMLPNLGISEEDLELLCNEVSIIYHCAATVRFDEPLRQAVLMNTRGTKYTLEVAAKIKHLAFFAYISTAYCHLHLKTVREQPYDPPANPHKVIQACEWLGDEEMGMIEKKILKDLPNSYAYTKALAEALVVEKFNELPAFILRPSIIIPIWRDPLPGWTDNINGPTGLLIGAGKGVIRTMYCNPAAYGDLLPVDVAVNCILLITWINITNKMILNSRVANLTTSNILKVSWGDIIEVGRWVIENEVPLNNVAWYPGGSIKTNYYIHRICMILFHWLPAVLVDSLLFLFRYPPVLCRIQNRISKGMEILEFYANNIWNFENVTRPKIQKLLNKKERYTYIIEKYNVDVVDYFAQCVYCARRLILKESDESIPAARRHMKMMWYVDKIVRGLWLFGFCYVLYRFFFASWWTTTTLIQSVESTS